MDRSKVNSEITHGNFGLEILLKEMIGDLNGGSGGNVYYVVQKSKAFYGSFLEKYQQTYEDGSLAVYGDDGDGLGIQEAIDACKGGRSDYILVGTGNYNLAAALTLVGKSSVHLLGVNGLTQDVGSLGAAALTQTGNFENIILEAYGEVAGFQIINKAGYSAVTCAAGKWRPTVHHNYFHMVGGADINLIDWSAANAGVSGRIYKNKFTTWVGGVLNSAINVGAGTGIDVIGNQIMASSTAMVLDYGILNNSIGGLTADNIVSECGGDGVATNGGTITVAVQIATSGTAVNNRCAVGTGQGLAGGTASHTFVDNRDGQAGGETTIET